MAHLVLPHELQSGVDPISTNRPLHLTALSTAVGKNVLPVADAIVCGDCDPEQAKKDGYSGLRQSELSVADMAREVALRTLEQSGTAGADLGHLSFSSIHETGFPGLWQPAAYLQKLTKAHSALAQNTSFGCNGLAISIAQVALMQEALSQPSLLVAADCFENSGFDRWRSDQGLAYGDAASALLISDKPGIAEICFLAVNYIPELEEMHRTDTSEYPVQAEKWNITRCKRDYIERNGSKAFFDQLNLALDDLEKSVEKYVGMLGKPLKAVVTPFVGRSIRSSTYDAKFNRFAPINLGWFGESVGHTGVSDQFVGFSHLVDCGVLKSGDHVLLIGAGAGFSLSAMIVRFDRKPILPILGDV